LAGSFDETARERSDDRIDGLWIQLGMDWAYHTPHRFGVLQQGVLESTAGTEKGATRLSRESDRGDRATGICVRTGRHAPHARKSGEPLRRILGQRRGVDPFPLTPAGAVICQCERSWNPLVRLRRRVV